MAQTMTDAARRSPADTARPFKIRRISDVAGGEITGIDLARPIDAATRDTILDAFLECHVLVFRDQDLSGGEQLAFTGNFGEIEDHVVRDFADKKVPDLHVVSNLDPDGNPTDRPYTRGNYFWHTDKSYHDVPSLATFLHARELPPSGGDTEFANMYEAYDALDPETRDRIASLKAVHSWEANRRNTSNRPATEQEKREKPPVAHPMIRTHPDTGRKTLYIGIHTSHVEGLPVAEGEKLLADLLRHASRRQFVYVHKWRPGDLVMWDNRCLLHRVIGNYDMDTHRRLMHRTVVKGTVPV